MVYKDPSCTRLSLQFTQKRDDERVVTITGVTFFDVVVVFCDGYISRTGDHEGFID